MGKPVTVAVIDGNPSTRRGLIQRLGQVARISVVGDAGESREALAIVGHRQPDVVVTDLRPIAPDGAEFLGRLARAAPRARIVVLTAYLTERERTDLTRAGAGAILLKEIDFETLARTIERVAAQVGAAGRRPET